jgi:low temperature requirement protein LtrA
MVAGIIVTAAADERILADPTVTSSVSTAYLVLGGTALFLAGHAAFKATVWRIVPWSRLAAIAVLGLLGIVATSISALALGAATSAVVVALAVTDRVLAESDPT